MASMDSSSVLPPPRYASHEFAPPYLPCSSGIPNSVATSIDGQTSSPRCGSSMKPVGSVSIASLNHTPTPSPSYPVANSWPGFDTKNSMGMLSAGPSEVKNMEIAAVDHPERRQRRNGVYVFTSKMANDSYTSVQEGKFKSILAWHEANFRPSTSTADEPTSARLDAKRKSTDTMGRTPDSVVHSNTGDSPKLKKQLSESGSRLSSADPMNVAVVSSSSDMLVNDDPDTNSTSDNPLRRMERMTQEPLFEPPARVSRGASSENDQSVRKMEDDNPDRETKLAKLKSIEKAMNGTKNRVQPQCSQAPWGVMMQEPEAMKIPPGYPQQMAPGYPSQGMINGPPPYQMPSHGIPAGMPHPAFRRPPFIGQMSPQVMSPVPQSTGPVMELMGAPGMQMAQTMRQSLNPPPYNMHMAPDGYMPYDFPPQPSSFPQQNYPMTMPSSVSPGYSPMFQAMNGAPIPPRGYSVYAQGPRPMYGPEKMVLPEMWGGQQLPPPLNNLEARIPNQKIQYHPNGAVIDENLGETINNMNPLFGTVLRIHQLEQKKLSEVYFMRYLKKYYGNF